MKLEQKISDAKKNASIKKADYVKRGRQAKSSDAVYCKLCGDKIAGYILDDSFSEATRANGQTIIRERMIWAEFPNYAELEIEFDDGSKHVTPACRRCANQNHSAEVLDAVHMVDVGRWKELGQTEFSLVENRKAKKAKKVK